MRVLISRVTDTGHLVTVRIPVNASFVARYADDGSIRDLTPHVADLLLSGALDATEARESGRQEPADTVEAAHIAYVEDNPAPGTLRPTASFSWLHLPSGQAGDFAAEEVIPLIVRGFSVEVTSAVAAEAAVVPDDASALTGPVDGPTGTTE